MVRCATTTRIATFTVIFSTMVGLAGCSAASSPSVEILENDAGYRAILLDGIDGDQAVDLPAVSGEIVVSGGCIALATERSTYILILPEAAEFTDEGRLDTTHGTYGEGESASFRGETGEPGDFLYGDQLPTDCGSDTFLALDPSGN